MTPTYTPADIAAAERDLAALMDMRDEEPDPEWRAELAWWIVDDAAWLARMMGELG